MNTVKSKFSQIIISKESLLFLILFIAGLSLLGWLFGKVILASVSSAFIPIAPSTAIIFIILSAGLLLQNKFRESPIIQSFITAFIALVVLFCLNIFLVYLFNFTWEIENIFIKNQNTLGNVPIGRMSPITALLFIFICAGLISNRQNITNTFKYLGGSFSLIACILSSVLLIGYLYNAPLLYGGKIIPVALPTAICFLLFSITLLRIFELKFWTYNLIKDNKISNQLLKWFLSISIFIIIFQGYLIANYSIIVNNPTLFVALALFIVIPINILLVYKVSSLIGIKLLTAEQKLKESEKQLLRINADKDRFISILGHDLKSPFNNILGLSEVLIEEIRNLSTDEIEVIAEKINKSSITTNKLLEDILIWSRAQQGSIPYQPKILNLSVTCRNILEILNPGAHTKNITIYDDSSNNINVYADSDMLKTILLNLVSNAIKFTNSGGKIIIKAEKNSENVTISVSDNGVGIPSENLSQLFEISEVLSTKGTAGETGTGLGLLLSKEFVEKNGGKIWVESEVGTGSDFKFTLPLFNEQVL